MFALAHKDFLDWYLCTPDVHHHMVQSQIHNSRVYNTRDTIHVQMTFEKSQVTILD